MESYLVALIVKSDPMTQKVIKNILLITYISGGQKTVYTKEQRRAIEHRKRVRYQHQVRESAKIYKN
jgi:hypothetical protein